MCRACSEVCSFLRLYPESIRAAGKKADSGVKVSKDKGMLEDMPITCVSEKSLSDICSSIFTDTDKSKAEADFESVSGEKDLLEGQNSDDKMVLNPCPEDSIKQSNCRLDVNIVDASPVIDSKPMFLSKNWRDALCKCDKCLEFYNQKQIAFLADKEDSIVEYEKVGKQKREENLQQQEGAELSFFNKLGHVEKVEILKGIEEMKDGLRAFLVRNIKHLLVKVREGCMALFD